MALSLTSRSALSTLNVDNNHKNIQAQKSASTVKQSLFKVPSSENKPISIGGCSKPTLKIHTDPAPVKVKTDVKHKVITKLPDPLPEIEKMHICNPEDMVAPVVHEQAEGMLRKLRKWSLKCLYPRDSLDSDSESEEEIELPVEDFDLEEPDPLADLSDIGIVDMPDHIPSIDELPIPFLDDSLDIEPNMGTLEVWDSSTPLTLSPSVREPQSSRELDSEIDISNLSV